MFGRHRIWQRFRAPGSSERPLRSSRMELHDERKPKERIVAELKAEEGYDITIRYCWYSPSDFSGLRIDILVHNNNQHWAYLLKFPKYPLFAICGIQFDSEIIQSDRNYGI